MQYETLWCLKFCVFYKKQSSNNKILSPKAIKVFESFFEKYLLGSFFDDIINFIIVLLGNLLVDNIEAKNILHNNKNLLKIISDIVLDESDNLRIDIAQNAVWLFSNLFKINDLKFDYTIV